MRKIQLINGGSALVDDIDFNELNKFKWHLTAGYASRTARSNGKGFTVLMHRVIVKPGHGQRIDHISGNKLDNRRSNLRLATNQQNLCNRGKTQKNTSGFKGVFWSYPCAKWRAQIAVNGHPKHLGVFDNKEAAYFAYRRAAKKYHGQFAHL